MINKKDSPSKGAHYVFVTNNMYNSDNILPFRWWNKLFGYPGRTVLAHCYVNGYSEHCQESFNAALNEFRDIGLRPQILDEYLFKDEEY